MTLDKWRTSALKGLDDMIRVLPDSVERAEVEDLFDALKESLDELVELEEEEED